MNVHRSAQVFQIVICLATGISLPTSVGAQIPQGIRYKPAPNAINQKAQAKLQKALSQPANKTDSKVLFADVVVCGPLLWQSLQKQAGPEVLKAATMIINLGGTLARKNGKAFQTPQEIRAFWQCFADRFKGKNPFTIRKANAAELEYHWATILFDIEEPLYVIVIGDRRVIVEFIVKNGDPRISRMDIAGEVKDLMSP